MRPILEKRQAVSRTAALLVPVVSFLFSLLLGAILLRVCGVEPAATYAAMARGAFGSWTRFTKTLIKAIPLMLTGLGVSIAFRMRFWNIGAAGQLTLGGIAATAVALFASPCLPGWTVLPAALGAGIAAGAAWAGVPALLRAYLRVDETLTTLMLNYVAVYYYEHLYHGPWRNPEGYGFPGTAPFPEAAWLPYPIKGVHLGLLFALVAAALLWFILKHTRWGFELRIIGENAVAARYLGINIGLNTVLALLVSGALSGLAGACEVTGNLHRLSQGLPFDLGYTAIIVAWMAQLNPAGVVMVAILMAGLLVGGDQLQTRMGLPAAISLVLQGMILFPMLAGTLFTEYRLHLVRRGRPAAAPAPEVPA
jgi:ABC-type uncharacterized transport system permease subunit